MNVASILVSIRQLFNEPNTAHSLNVDIAKHCAEDPEGYKKVAQEWTQKYATEGGSAAAEATSPAGATNSSAPASVSTATTAATVSSNSTATSADASAASTASSTS